MNLKGKVALVTGSTSGIGLGIARALAGAGRRLVLNGFGDAGRDRGRPRRARRGHGVRVRYNGADMSQPAADRRAGRRPRRGVRPVDILVNNAGIQHVAPIDEFPPEKWDAIIAINLSAAFHAIRRRCPAMSERGGAGSSTSPRRTAWSRARRSRPMSPPSTASSA